MTAGCNPRRVLKARTVSEVTKHVRESRHGGENREDDGYWAESNLGVSVLPPSKFCMG